MALKIKVKTIRLPIIPENQSEVEGEVEDCIEKKLVDGFTLEQVICNGAIVMLIFKKE